ncbi:MULTISPECIES: helix-turn-helix domain-containing protein [Paenibacillus]|uniref:Helix-turn-helix domain-containing protein n=1 Tax=Paenibacillus taichungensis TaxID=484184 RepID=A0ABX2MK03_9BACL|nr:MULTISPECIES: helix-turn-helix domain-containing protein [Paenibacillus]NUU54364.1 helix-turn-helix domain-containing protein [Paenibacillus taichungensis]SLJ98385.1 DNA binding domain-containing protein, excisionase family [Paenibacillus sp. RU5A]SOC66769.1 DNA binding domain-containing protein, excisionase family [Paenibacillus sp. RU26A]SOC70082.1 DNA binding domain-containing protein, excisionase family [Paenibacillus sp. RU5M]
MNVEDMAGRFFAEVREQLLSELRAEIEQDIPKMLDRKRLTVSEAAKYLNVSEPAIYAMCKEGSLPHYKIGTQTSTKPAIRFRIEKLDEWIVKQEKMNSREEPDDE